MKPIIIVYKALPEDQVLRLEQYFDVRHYSYEKGISAAFYEDLARAEGIIGSRLKVDSNLLDQAPNLKIVVNTSVGYDNFDIEELTRRGIMATNTPDVLTDTVADTVIGLLIATARRIPEMDRYVKDGNWNGNIEEGLFGVDVHHKVLGIIGMGRIGTAIAERAHHGFKMDIRYNNRSSHSYAEETLQAKRVSLEQLLKESDFVLAMPPLTADTAKLIGKKEFQQMKNTAIFINGSRGGVVDEQALVFALQNNEILAAGLDVYENEPISKESALLKMDNVVTLPHIGSATSETRYQMAKLGVDNLVKGLSGEVPPSLINRELLVREK